MCYNYSRRGGGSLLFLIFLRGVAQLGSALGSGPRGRRFESCRSDQQRGVPIGAFFFCFFASTNLVIARAFRRTTRQAPERDSSKGNGSGMQKRKKKQTSLISRRAGNGCDRKKRKGRCVLPKHFKGLFIRLFVGLYGHLRFARRFFTWERRKRISGRRGGRGAENAFSAVVNGGRGNTGKHRETKEKQRIRRKNCFEGNEKFAKKGGMHGDLNGATKQPGEVSSIIRKRFLPTIQHRRKKTTSRVQGCAPVDRRKTDVL